MSARHEFRAGWRNLAAATLGMGLGVPIYSPVSSLFFQALRDSFAWSNAATAGALVALPITALVLPFAGMLIDRAGMRIVTGLSALLLAAGFAWLSRLGGGLPEFYAALIALNVLGCATGPIGYTRLVANDFEAARGAALAVAQFGIASVAVFLPPLLALVIATSGWRSAYIVLAGVALVGGASAQFLMQPTDRRAVVQPAATSGSPATAIGSIEFWQLGTAIFLVSAGSIGLVSQLQPALIDRGLAAGTAGLFLSLLAVSVLASRLVVGRLLDLARPNVWSAAVLR